MKCCLRYEDKNYNELKARLPKKNTLVKSDHGQGTVVDAQILTQLVMVNYGDGKIEAVPLEELEILSGPSKQQARENDRPNKDNKDQNNRAYKPNRKISQETADNNKSDNDNNEQENESRLLADEQVSQEPAENSNQNDEENDKQ